MCEAGKILLILKSIAANYPILSEYELGFTKLLVLVVDKGQTKVTKSLLSETGIPSINEFMSLRQIEEIFKESNSDFVVYPYSCSKKSLDFMTLLKIIVRTGECAGRKIGALPIVITEGIPQGYDAENCFTVFLNGSLEGNFISICDVVPSDEQLAVVMDKIGSIVPNAKSQDERCLLAAACFFYPSIVHTGTQVDFEEILELARNLVVLNEENLDTEGIEVAFIQELYNWQEKEDFHEIFDLPCLEMGVVEKLDTVILFDGKYIYLKDSLLKVIVKPLLRIFAIDTIKQELAKTGILCPEKENSYTIKLGFYNLAGQYQRVRMLRFDVEKLNCPGELNFVELCTNEKGGF